MKELIDKLLKVYQDNDEVLNAIAFLQETLERNEKIIAVTEADNV